MMGNNTEKRSDWKFALSGVEALNIQVPKRENFSVILILMLLVSCESQKKFEFDKANLAVKSCDGTMIYKASVESSSENKIYTIPITSKGSKEIKVFSRINDMSQESLPLLKPNASYKILIGGGHSTGYIEVFTDENAEISSIENKTPCQ